MCMDLSVLTGGSKAKSEGATLQFHEYEGLFHVWMAAPIPEAKKALDEIAAFIRMHI